MLTAKKYLKCLCKFIPYLFRKLTASFLEHKASFLFLALTFLEVALPFLKVKATSAEVALKNKLFNGRFGLRGCHLVV